MKAIIFAGGVGSRLWPLSRKKTPKQFMDIVDSKTMLQLCIDRLTPGFDLEDIYIVTGKDYVGSVRKQLPALDKRNIIAEPTMRDVGPAVGLISAIFAKKFPNYPIALLWGSDHLVKKEGFFRRILRACGDVIEKNPNKIILIGQKPRFASQNLGWIAYDEKVFEKNKINFYQLEGFQYRPDKKTAEKYFMDKKHVWNLGYWVTTPSYLWSLFEKFSPQLFRELKKIQDAYETPRYEKVLNEVYPHLEKISFDNAIVEKMDFKNGLVVSADLGWSDVGAWEGLKEALQTSKEANVTQGRVLLEDSLDNLVYNFDNDKVVVGIDLNDFLIVNTDDVLLVTKKASVPKIKKLVKSLKGTKYEKLT
ncbi:hypothetical protein A3H80_00110 [Candidatus Roizmanbacteria bacterium RIFCSPLOWO2_02_FULL_37_19]|uniref:Nucleotidyl transferase domain-containing protein n=1 Tax=Candidatus Roizmanbacteria bacterium RIFCSPHIGHO2_02_FULL_37_24 TaxID=1802037 RepID=A0A1F7GU76_9BACT|nr:MAG: hypothetical protein A3C24_04595 [Candidatus Roizmanbacteria bacterium RIFCSPHIGHO2_02_FULL_37_24]OGK33337.1 MAG: hypothetical protein A3E10_03145 [Candidatus Roizmanbacteria bacterium RIFCSPHIGHO2_12_FULL_37_23]OGK53929.1 MAG: hypothetical protein A3H80_00110 [Candidatus Roizmanbacteria bacterium RIFCSPLOWO2_02_FULL_37_19]OGK61833.1 MAG: hypothetical protein A3G65_04205 [Candidatus Roizmanbacteria bacterium RIFCSPLOWO2_12_FULL_37_7b]